ncbi:hypothetical protein FRC17_007346, partial [Serendipita sp. 399]
MTISEKLRMLRSYTPSASEAVSESGLNKLEHFLKKSADRQCKYAWIDTICINKESSTELDESIRSMFAWYRDSHICIVHLSETNSRFDLDQDPWFKRGWTLQELLAPRRLAFYSQDWNQITRNDCIKHSVEQENQGKSEERLWSEIAIITGIEAEDLHNFTPGLYDIKKRMGWASSRKTTRIEDMAYCLIGIFDVDLSIAYGERERAFYRLQVEILQNCADMGLFDWLGPGSAYNSMLAISPACFEFHQSVHLDGWLQDNDATCTYTNLGIRVPQALFKLNEEDIKRLHLHKDAVAFAFLGDSSNPTEILILILGEGDRRGQY